MRYFLTSSPCVVGASIFNEENNFVQELRQALPQRLSGLFVCSSPDDPERTDRFSQDMKDCFEEAGFVFDSYRVLDRRTEQQAAALIQQADLIILAGGHVPTQNRFFAELGLRALLQNWYGVLMGISAGTMNSAEVVYAHPELEGETAPDYRKFLSGLGLTKTMVLPHYQMIKDDVLDGLRVFEDIAYPDSMGRRFYALVDGSYIFGNGTAEELRGEAYLIEDGVLTQISKAGDTIVLH